MPLKKGKSKKTISSFLKTMSYMFSMFERMAIWAKNFKVRKTIIFPISIFMVDAQYRGNSIVPASFACLNHASQSHIFSDGFKRRVPHFFFRFIYAFHSTVNAIFRGICEKFFSTVFAVAGHRPFKVLRFIITLFAAIFCSVRTRRNVRELFPASLAACCNLNSCGQSFTASRTILETVKSVFGDINKCFAMPTTQVFASKGF
jgi:hypothetical protein